MRDKLGSAYARLTGKTEQPRLFPLSHDDTGLVRLSFVSRFSRRRLEEHVARYPGLVWHAEGTNQYIIGGYWRHRPEIGAVLEINGGSWQEALLQRLADVYLQQGCRLVVVDYDEQQYNLAPYLHSGFAAIDHIIHYERQIDTPVKGTNEVSVRPLVTDDLPQVLEADNAAFSWLWWNNAEEFRHYRRLSGVELYVATLGDRVVGYAGITLRGRESHLDRLAVHPQFQGRGCGSALLVFVINHMAERRVGRVGLSTQVSNIQAQCLYNKFGFRRKDWNYHIYGQWLRQPPSL